MVRFLADASLHHAIVSGCSRREPTIDILSAQAAKLCGVSAADVLAIAAEQGRILVTHDSQTTSKYFGTFIAAGPSSPGDYRPRFASGREISRLPLRKLILPVRPVSLARSSR